VCSSTLPDDTKGAGVTHLSPGSSGLIITCLWLYDLKLHEFSSCFSRVVKDFSSRIINGTIDSIEVTWHMTISTSETVPEMGT